MSSDACKKELKAIEERKAAEKANNSDFAEKTIGGDCVIHRLISSDHWDEVNNICLPEAFDDKRLSFLIEKGEGFDPATTEEISSYLKELRDKHPDWGLVGAVKLKAQCFIGKNELKHDPYPVVNKKLNTTETQHRNHGQAICTKDLLFTAELAQAAEWSIHPSETKGEEDHPPNIPDEPDTSGV